MSRNSKPKNYTGAAGGYLAAHTVTREEYLRRVEELGRPLTQMPPGMRMRALAMEAPEVDPSRPERERSMV